MKKTVLIILIFILASSNSFCLSCKFQNKNKARTSTVTEYKHRIDIEEEKCLEKTDVYNYEICTQKAELAWDNEIKNNLKKLKEIIPKEDYGYIEEMDKSWNETIQLEIKAVNKLIYNKDGKIYQTVARNNISELKKSYAMFLNSIYSNYAGD